MIKFAIGDRVIGNENANRYRLTAEGRIGTVINAVPNAEGEVLIHFDDFDLEFNVRQNCFDLHQTTGDYDRQMFELQKSLRECTEICHGASVAGGWWHDIHTGKKLERNKGELLALIHSEVSEALEGVRKDAMDDKLPHRKMEEVELADTLIRIFDYAGGFGLDIGGALVEKLEYNKNREDHKVENRLKSGGKKI